MRFRLTPNFKKPRTWVIGAFVLLSVLAGLDGDWFAVMILGGMAALVTMRMLQKCAYSKTAILQALAKLDAKEC